jgi:hypothetical protein
MLILDLKAFLIEPISLSSSLLQLGWIPLYIPAGDAQSIEKEIDKNTSSADFVIAPDNTTWMLSCHSADIRTVYTYEADIKGVDQKIGLKDFVIDSSLSSAKYVVVYDTRRYYYGGEYKVTLDEVTTWSMVMSKGDEQLYCNPSFCK